MHLLPSGRNDKRDCGIDFKIRQGGNRAYVCGVHITLNDVEDRDVARRLARYGGNHPIFGL